MGDIDVGEALGKPVEIMKGNYGFFVPPLLPAIVDLIGG